MEKELKEISKAIRLDNIKANIDHAKTVIKNLTEYNKQISNLAKLSGENLYGNKAITDLIDWTKKEYERTNKIYPGDHWVISQLSNYVAKGLSLNEATTRFKTFKLLI